MAIPFALQSREAFHAGDVHQCDLVTVFQRLFDEVPRSRKALQEPDNAISHENRPEQQPSQKETVSG